MTDARRPRLSPMKTGLRSRCPRCGEASIFKGYLSLREACPACDLSYDFADPADGPAFFGMSVVGLVGMALFMWFEFTVHPPVWVHMVVTLPLLVLACLAVLRPLKGWLVAEQYVHKAAEAQWDSVGGHGDGSKWR
jgi:uncharacterized protein (DUF983 family)